MVRLIGSTLQSLHYSQWEKNEGKSEKVSAWRITGGST